MCRSRKQRTASFVLRGRLDLSLSVAAAGLSCVHPWPRHSLNRQLQPTSIFAMDELTPLRRSSSSFSGGSIPGTGVVVERNGIWRRAHRRIRAIAALALVACLLVYVAVIWLVDRSGSATATSTSSSPTDPTTNSDSRLRQSGAFYAESKSDEVTYVPGFGTPLETQYAGLVTVNAQAVGKLFYWFFETSDTTSNNAETPLMVWLNGGPGASSMTGLLTEMGPYRIVEDGKLIPHAQSWSQLGHMLFFDQPVGTGYTSVRDDNGYVSNQDQMAQQLYRGLKGFYARHPEYAANPVYICGESYAGKYVPYISHYIHEKNAANTEESRLRINLTGVAIGNGLMWPVLQSRSVPDFALALGLIDSQQYEKANVDISQCEEFHRQGRHLDAFQVCNAVMNEVSCCCGFFPTRQV